MSDLSSLLSPLSVKGSELMQGKDLLFDVVDPCCCVFIFLSLLSIHVCDYSLCCITTHITPNYFLLSSYLLFSSPHTLLVHVSLASPLVVCCYSCLPCICFSFNPPASFCENQPSSSHWWRTWVVSSLLPPTTTTLPTVPDFCSAPLSSSSPRTLNQLTQPW
jgi:hypothetical protein